MKDRPPSVHRRAQSSRRRTRSCSWTIRRLLTPRVIKCPTKTGVFLFFVPNVDADCSVSLNALHAHNHVQLVLVPHNATTEDIRQLVTSAFSTLPAIQNTTASMHGFVWLTKKSRGRGTRGVLVVNKREGDFKVQDLEWCARSAMSSF